MTDHELWQRDCTYLCAVPNLGLTLDVSRMTFERRFLRPHGAGDAGGRSPPWTIWNAGPSPIRMKTVWLATIGSALRSVPRRRKSPSPSAIPLPALRSSRIACIGVRSNHHRPRNSHRFYRSASVVRPWGQNLSTRLCGDL